jgi:glycosyltransferase involved in cell wall biosynthesis
VSEDYSGTAGEYALEYAGERTFFFVHALATLPTGLKTSLFPRDERLLDQFRRARGVIACGKYVAERVRELVGVAAEPIYFPIFGKGPFPRYEAVNHPYVLMINPCALKGIDIFLELARRMPDVAFAGVPTWGATARDREALGKMPNVTLLQPDPEIGNVLKHARVTLVPSVCEEALGAIGVESMLRGVPSLCGDYAGMREAKLGLPGLLPVKPVVQYVPGSPAPEGARVPLPEAVVPPQDSAPWEQELRHLLADRAYYEEIAALSHRVSNEFVAKVGAANFEAYFHRVMARATP